MYDTIRREIYWLHAAKDVYKALGDCCECEINRARLKRKRHLKLFPGQRDPGIPCNGPFGPAAKWRTGNQFIVVIIARCTKLTRKIPSSKTTAPHVALVFFDKRVVLYGITAFFLTDSSLQIVNKLFETLYTFLWVKHLRSSAYYPPTNVQDERFNQTILPNFRLVVAEHHHNWE